MAQATGTITFSSVPDQYTKITIGDGQGGAYSDLILAYFLTLTPSQELGTLELQIATTR